MTDWSLPTLASLYTDFHDTLKARDVDALLWLDGTTTTNIPIGAKRWNSTNNNWEKYNGSTWAPLATKYMIDVDTVDGKTVNDGGSSVNDLWTASKISAVAATKLDSSSYTASDVLAKLLTVDGSGSGLDADLLDGQTGSYYTNGDNFVWGITDTTGKFYTGTTTPTGATRLNYSGYLYPTWLNLTGSSDTTANSSHVFIEVGSDGFVRPKTLANFKSEIFASPTFTGTASGTFSGNLTGSATLLNGAVDDTAATAGTIVKRASGGYIYAGAYNSTLADTATAASHYYVETGSDGWLRPKTLANVKAEIGASLGMTGVPTAPTAAAGTNTTQVATTAFVLANSDNVDTANVTTAYAGLSFRGLGSYLFASTDTSNGSIVAGSTVAGSTLSTSGVSVAATAASFAKSGGQGGSTITGTWMAMGNCVAGGAGYYPTTLWLRVA